MNFPPNHHWRSLPEPPSEAVETASVLVIFAKIRTAGISGWIAEVKNIRYLGGIGKRRAKSATEPSRTRRSRISCSTICETVIG